MSLKKILLCLLSSSLICCTKIDGTLSSHTKPVKIADHLYEISYDEYESLPALQYVNSIVNVSQGGACTVAGKGRYIGRNFDYFYSEMAEFIIRVSAAQGRYASIGVASSIFELTDRNAAEDPYGQYFDILPYFTIDGINEKGLFCAINFACGDEGSKTSGTNPDASETLCLSMAVRYVLDHCATVDEACNALEDKNIVFLEALGEFHFFLADSTETRVVEMYDNKMVCRQPKADVMTNFYVLSDSFLKDNRPGRLGEGVERYEYALQHLDGFTSMDGTSEVMKELRFSKAYDMSVSPFWYSDYYGYTFNGIVIDSNTPKDLYADFVKDKCEGFTRRTRDYLQEWWITTHTSVYDIEGLKMRVYAQEHYDEYLEFEMR